MLHTSLSVLTNAPEKPARHWLSEVVLCPGLLGSSVPAMQNKIKQYNFIGFSKMGLKFENRGQ
jgi:hypothetical protein